MRVCYAQCMAIARCGDEAASVSDGLATVTAIVGLLSVATCVTAAFDAMGAAVTNPWGDRSDYHRIAVIFVPIASWASSMETSRTWVENVQW